MKIIDDKTGLEIQNPDLTQGRLRSETEAVEHPAQEGVPELSHYETVAEYPNGGRDVRKVIDREGVPARDAWTEQVPIKRYILYTAEELAAQEEERKKQAERKALPETVKALQAALQAAQTAQSDTDAMVVDHEYRMALLELGITDADTETTT